MGHVKQIVYSLLDLEKPVVARIQGACVGLGATVALFSDIIIAAENARFGDPHVKVGAVAGDGGALIWPQLVGFARAKQYLLTGEIMTAQEAERIGLINKVVPLADLDAEVDQDRAPACEWRDPGDPLDEAGDQYRPAAAGARRHGELRAKRDVVEMKLDDHREALAAFRERRKPKFASKQTK